MRVLNNQLYINLFYNNFNQDKSDDLLSTANQESALRFPISRWAIFVVYRGYASISRSNDIAANDTAALLIRNIIWKIIPPSASCFHYL
jgi:hypothetical protein